MELLDAYAHVGLPRFASAEDALETLAAWGISRANLVLFPGSPDFPSMLEARARAPERVRLIGIPFGTSENGRCDAMRLQLDWGVSGFRFMPFEIPANVPGLRLLGEEGRWLFLINPFHDPPTLRFALDWLEEHPAARIASPHFLHSGLPDDLPVDRALFEKLLAHPRFHAILSRHGGASTAPYPHEDLRPWLEFVVDRVGWDRLLWGSEFPVLFWRDELLPEARDWLTTLLPDLPPPALRAFFSENSRRLFFDSAPPTVRSTEPPPADWKLRPERGAPLPLAGSPRLAAPAPLAARLLRAYYQLSSPSHPLRWTEFLLQRLEDGLPTRAPIRSAGT